MSTRREESHEGGTSGCLVTVASASLLLGSPALADPPPGQNPNAGGS
jgi:hypothetical protein